LPLRFWLVQPYRNYWIVYDPEKNRCASFELFTPREIFRAQ